MCQHPLYPQRSVTVEHPLLPRITDLRLDRFFGSPYASQHLDKLLDRHRTDTAEHVHITHWAAPLEAKPTFDEAKPMADAHGAVIQKGFRFGPSWSNHWLKVELNLPAWAKGAETVIFELDPSCEGLVFLPDGTPVHGLTGGPNTMKDGKPGEQADRRVEYILPDAAVRDGSHEFYVEVSANLMFGLGTFRYQTPDPNMSFPLISADIVVPNPHARGLRHDFSLLVEIARHPDTKLYGLSQRALKAADDIMNRFERGLADKERDDMLIACREIARRVLGDQAEWKKDGGKVWAIGHCHIDTAWLWRYTQTQQKIARSWTTQCDLMDRWPQHQFCASSAQQYKWLEELYPKGFERVKSYIAQGRFHYVGGAWLEHDCMMPSGESLVRQYYYGQRYFKEKFGAYCREAWLPDTFGYASQLPQILRLAGLQYFFTQKIGWNNINVFPYSTFNWAGLDGSQVLAHMTPVDQYNGQCHFEEIVKGVRDNKNLEVSDSCLFLFGNGDGGGGPTPLMMEKLERLNAVSAKEPIVPDLQFGSPIDFFDELCRDTDGGRVLPTWRGELYLELHRGTYTTQAKVKAGNRDMETLLRDLEYFSTMASLRGHAYPRAEIDAIWQDVMLGQFHDCLPGTTINTVVKDNLDIYARRGAEGRALLSAALDALLTPGPRSVFDPLRLERDQVYEHDGELFWLQTTAGGVGALALAPDHPELCAPKGEATGHTDAHIENDRFIVKVSSGRLTSIYDRIARRELIVPGSRESDGGLVLFEDIPLTYDAWDAEVYHLKCGQPIRFDRVEVRQAGPGLRASIVGYATFGGSPSSSAVVTISLDALSGRSIAAPLIRVHVQVDWHERHKFLKFALPLDIHSSTATFGTQFGTIDRPTHRNTRVDQAKFEVCAHGFADLSEANYGVTLACRDKYGYAVEGNTMRLSLVRAPTTPDPETDQGRHEVEFAIIPHAGRGAMHMDAMRFNNACYVVEGTVEVPRISIEGEGSEGIVLETIKRGDGETVVLRMHEAIGGRARGALRVDIPVKKAEWVDILEEHMTDCPIVQTDAGVEVELDFKVFEIKTLLLHLA